MPKFVEYESEDDDEIEVIPYVKPPPPVIDLIEEDDSDKQEPSRKSSKEKKSKKKRKKNKDIQHDSEESAETANNSFLSGEEITTAVNVETVNSSQAKKADRNVEQSAVTGSDNESSPSNLSSKNVVSQNRAYKTGECPASKDKHGSQQMIVQPNSIIESGINEVESGSNSKVVSTPEVRNANDTASSTSRTRKQSSSKPKRPRKMSQQTASKKTAAEISSFLNTLGIPIEVRDLTPVTRKRTERSPRGVRKSLDMAIADVPPSPADDTDPPIAKKSKKSHNEIEENQSSESKQKEKHDKLKDREIREQEQVDKQTMPPPSQPQMPPDSLSSLISPSPAQNILSSSSSLQQNKPTSTPRQNVSPSKKMPPPLPPKKMPPSSPPQNIAPPKKIQFSIKTPLLVNNIPPSSSQNMPPPPPPQTAHFNISSKIVKRKSSEYFLNHPGFPAVWTDEMKTFYGSFRGKNYNEKDVYKRQSNSRSMWKTPMDNMFQRKRGHGIRCSICHQHGHVNRNCPDKYKPLCCFMCGGKGHTYDSGGRNRCPETCCLNCGLQREKFSSGCSQCLYRRQPLRCHLCGVSGHSQANCPDNWRRYHSITSPLPNGAEEILTSISVTHYKRSHELYCCNCASPGHNYYDCNAPRYKNNPFHRNKPHIVKEVDMNSVIAHFGHETSQTDLPMSPVVTPDMQCQTPIASPSRTVVFNRNLNEKVKEQSEVISIQIQNDPIDVEGSENSLVKKGRSCVETSVTEAENVEQCSQYPDCGNKTTRLQQVCHHIAVNGYQQSLLLKAEETGAIRPIEERCQVNISILRETLQVHISGENWKAAENELYEILFTKAKEEQMARDNAKAKGAPHSPSGETTRKVVNDGDNISVVISKPLFLNKTFVPAMPAVPALPLVPSMDVDERFASVQDLITNIPIMRPDGPFAPGQYVPYSVLQPSLVPGSSIMPIPESSTSQNLTQSIAAPIETQDSKNKSSSLHSSEKPSTSPAVMLNPANKITTATEISTNSSLKYTEVTTIEDSDDEIVILEEIQEPPKKIQKVLKKVPLKGEEGLNVFLLPSEWDVVFADSIKKDGILQKIAKLFEVTIFVSKELNTCTISEGSSFDRQKAKEKVTLWLGCHAAKTTFVLHTPEDNSANVTPLSDVPLSASQSHNTGERISRRGLPPSPKRRTLGSPRSKGSINSRRGGSPLRRYNPVPNTNSSVLSSSCRRSFDEKGNNQKSPKFSRPFRGMAVSRGTNSKPQTESSKRRFRYFN